MRRAPFAIAATGAGLGLLLSYHTRPVSTSLAVPATLPPTTSTSSPSGSTSTIPQPAATTSPVGGPTATVPPAPATTAPSATRSATGQDIGYQYGDLQLEVIEKGSTITEIDVVSDGAADPRSAQINSEAIPILQQQALSAQSANIDGVSGATFTSAAFVQALQSALDQLGS